MYIPKRKGRVERTLRCPVCNGEGKVKVKAKDGSETVEPCPRCNGTGYIEGG